MGGWGLGKPFIAMGIAGPLLVKRERGLGSLRPPNVWKKRRQQRQKTRGG